MAFARPHDAAVEDAAATSRSDGLPSGELARGLGVGQPNVTGIVDRLIGQRLVAREPDSQDRRVIRVVLSDEGRALVENLQQAGRAPEASACQDGRRRSETTSRLCAT
ncbi:MAG: MarR family transcriptional regulator [Chloroflexia bacterium]